MRFVPVVIAEVARVKTAKKDEHPARENTKASRVSFFTQTTNIGHDLTDNLNIANSLPKTKHPA